MPKQKKTVLVFGTFDGLHDGHRFFLRAAQKLGNRLIASVATDMVVTKLKRQPPVYSQAERLLMLTANGLVALAIPGDTEVGRWSAIQKYKPDVVALGYDQSKLEQSLRDYIQKEGLLITLVNIEAHEPEHLHSRLLRKK